MLKSDSLVHTVPASSGRHGPEPEPEPEPGRSVSHAAATAAVADAISVHLQIISDVICPWCALGKRLIDTAVANIDYKKLASQRTIAALPAAAAAAAAAAVVSIKWLPYEVAPKLRHRRKATSRRTKHDAYMKKFGEHRTRMLESQLHDLGASEDVKLDFTFNAPIGSSFDAHRLLDWAQKYESIAIFDECTRQDRAHTLADNLFVAVFEKCLDIEDGRVLQQCAMEAGFSSRAEQKEIQHLLFGKPSDSELAAIHDIEEAFTYNRQRAPGVPTVMFQVSYSDGSTRKFRIGGAQNVQGIIAILHGLRVPIKKPTHSKL
jgi:predicted DsbA family dithiol-disulfide isomerase